MKADEKVMNWMVENNQNVNTVEEFHNMFSAAFMFATDTGDFEDGRMYDMFSVETKDGEEYEDALFRVFRNLVHSFSVDNQ